MIAAVTGEMALAYTGGGDYAATPDQHKLVALAAAPRIVAWWPENDAAIRGDHHHAVKRARSDLRRQIKDDITHNAQARVTADGPDNAVQFVGILSYLFVTFILPSLINAAISAIINYILRDAGNKIIHELKKQPEPPTPDATSIV